MTLEVKFLIPIPEGTSRADAEEWADFELSHGGTIRGDNPLVEAGEEVELNKLDITEYTIVD